MFKSRRVKELEDQIVRLKGELANEMSAHAATKAELAEVSIANAELSHRYFELIQPVKVDVKMKKKRGE